jgi:hypothetical protein
MCLARKQVRGRYPSKHVPLKQKFINQFRVGRQICHCKPDAHFRAKYVVVKRILAPMLTGIYQHDQTGHRQFVILVQAVVVAPAMCR